MYRAFYYLFLTIMTINLTANDVPSWHLDGDDKGWSDTELALKYLHYSELQRQWAHECLSLNPIKSSDRVLDFGCGDGKITAQIALGLNTGSIYGVDLSKSMFNVSKTLYPNEYYPNLEYSHISSIDFSVDEDLFSEEFDKIISFCVFHLVKNPVEVLKNLKSHIKDDGTLLMVVPAGVNEPFFNAANNSFEKYGLLAPWSAAKPKGVTSQDMRSLEGAQSILESSGWDVKTIYLSSRPHVFYNRDEFVKWMVWTIGPNWNIPKEISFDFFGNLADWFNEFDPHLVKDDASYHFPCSRIYIEAKVQ